MRKRDLHSKMVAWIIEGHDWVGRLKSEGLPDVAIMRLLEKRAGLVWDEASQSHRPDPDADWIQRR